MKPCPSANLPPPPLLPPAPQYGGHNIALEIQATLPHPPTVARMMRGVHIAFVFTGIAYFCVAITGFNALGAKAGSNIILSLSVGPLWVRNVARLMVVVHVAAAYQGARRGGMGGWRGSCWMGD